MFKKFFEKNGPQSVETEKKLPPRARLPERKNKHDEIRGEYVKEATDIRRVYHDMIQKGEAKVFPAYDKDGAIIGQKIIRVKDSKELYFSNDKAILEYWSQRDRLINLNNQTEKEKDIN